MYGRPPPDWRGPPPRGGGFGGPYARDGPSPREQAIVPMPAPGPPAEPIDREKTCPLLMRVFPRNGGHHRLEEFVARTPGADVGLPKEEIQIYTWMDASLRELSELIQEVHPAARSRTARLSFALVYPDRRGRHVLRPVGFVHATRHSDDDEKTLRSLNFQTGDYLDVAVLVS